MPLISTQPVSALSKEARDELLYDALLVTMEHFYQVYWIALQENTEQDRAQLQAAISYCQKMLALPQLPDDWRPFFEQTIQTLTQHLAAPPEKAENLLQSLADDSPGGRLVQSSMYGVAFLLQQRASPQPDQESLMEIGIAIMELRAARLLGIAP